MTDLGSLARNLHDLAARAEQIARSLESAVAHLDQHEPCQSDMNPLLDQHDLAKLLRVGDRTLRRMRNDGRIPDPIMFGSKPRWLRSTIEAFLEKEQRR